ncbi:MAG: cytochrome C [Deltaproteobacteria bacterium]|nr:cytochrome C [Deltaproteobacteria bacterium]
MRRSVLSAVLGAVLFCVGATAAFGGLKVLGTGEQKRLDPSGFPPDMKESYALMEIKCANTSNNCHGVGRAVEAIVTGIAPNSKTPFDKEAAKQYGVKMMRKPDSGVNKQEAKTLVQLMYYLIDEARKK